MPVSRKSIFDVVWFDMQRFAITRQHHHIIIIAITSITITTTTIISTADITISLVIIIIPNIMITIIISATDMITFSLFFLIFWISLNVILVG